MAAHHSRVVFSPALAAAALLLFTGLARAEPYLAVRYGYKCSQCHFNPTGGGKRNQFGTIFSQTEMPNRVVSPGDIQRLLNAGKSLSGNGESAPSENPLLPSTFYSGYLASFLSLGGDFRFNYSATFGGRENPDTNGFDISAANLYLSLELLEGAAAFYLDEKVAPGGVSSREAYGILRGPWSSYIKAGQMYLPFGLRLQDDSAFIREITGFNFGVQDLGVEVGLEPGPLSISMAVSNGSQGSSDNNSDKQFTGMASFIQRYWRLGAQATWNNTPAVNRVAVGGFGGVNLGFIDVLGVNLGRFTLLGEIDHIIDELNTLPGEPTNRQLLLYGAVNCQLLKGVDLQFAYDYADPDLSLSDDSFIRLSAGVEYTVTQFVQLRAFYRFRDETEDSPRDDESLLDFEVHIFF